jgi:tripartite-type tricarboxylate transporter receptor subunit TctC
MTPGEAAKSVKFRRPRGVRSLFHVGLALLLPLSEAIAQTRYPAKPVRIIVPLAAASAVDNAARLLAQKMSDNLGQQIVVENQPGAAGLIGADHVAKATPDGYTLGGFNDSVLTMLPNLYAHMPWDPVKDFAPVSLVATIEWGLVAANNTPFNSAADLIAAAKASPGTINYSSGGNGSPQHIAMGLFAASAGISLTHVPYKGATQAALDVASGQIAVAFLGLSTITTLVRGGRMKLLAVTTPRRLPSFPDTPTVGESGLPGFEFNSWFALVAPAKTPADVIVSLNGEIVKALAAPEIRDKLIAQGFTIRGSSPEELGATTRAQLARYARLIKEAGIVGE